MDNIHILLEAFFYFFSIFFLWLSVYLAIMYRTKKIVNEIKHEIQVSDAGLSTLIYDLDAKITELSQDIESFHDVNREILRLLAYELRQKEYQQDGWKPSRNKEHMVELAIQEAKTKKRRPGRPPRTHVKSSSSNKDSDDYK